MVASLRPRSIRGRVTLTALIMFALVLGAGVIVTSLSLRTQLLTSVTNDVARAADKTVEAIGQGSTSNVLHPAGEIIRLQVVTKDGRVVAASPAMSGQPAITGSRPVEGAVRVDGTSCITFPGDEQRCFVTVGLRYRNSPYGDVMVYAAAPRPLLVNGNLLEIALIAFSIMLLVLLGWGTWRLVGRTLKPVERIRSGLAEITTSDLSRRMPVPEGRDEVTQLAQTVNATLERLERAVENERRFASDASHELRTPLTGLRTKLELALADPDADDPVQTMRSALHDTERLQAIMDDLLLLARLDAGVLSTPELIDLAELVTTEVERRPFRLEVLLVLKPNVVVKGNRLQLSRLLANLLANADRHAMSEVRVHVGCEGGEAVVEVVDDGLGIPPDDRERVFQRFTRLDSARSRDAGGTGLGLPIARDIASAHHGSLYATDSTNGRGARLVLRLPLSTTISV